MNADGHWLASDMYKINAVNKKCEMQKNGKKTPKNSDQTYRTTCDV